MRRSGMRNCVFIEYVSNKEYWEGNTREIMVGIQTESKPFVIGFVVYRHIMGQLRKKLDDKEEMMILVGYHCTSGYKLFNKANKRVMISQDIIVDEIKKL